MLVWDLCTWVCVCAHVVVSSGVACKWASFVAVERRHGSSDADALGTVSVTEVIGPSAAVDAADGVRDLRGGTCVLAASSLSSRAQIALVWLAGHTCVFLPSASVL
jgi:hypothetical protein